MTEPDSNPSSMIPEAPFSQAPVSLIIQAKWRIMFHGTVIPGKHSLSECPHSAHQTSLVLCIFSKTPFRTAFSEVFKTS